MELRTSVLPALIGCSLFASVVVQAAPSDPSSKPASASASAATKPEAPPAKPATAVSKPSGVPSAAAPAPAAPATPPPPAPASPADKSATTSAVSPAPSKPLAKLPAPKTPLEAALQQVVVLERAGRPIAVGTLLAGDGRILTALSPLTHGNQIDARYPEGQLVRVKLTHSDRAWDLALLTPEGEPRHAGIKASREPAPNSGAKLHALTYVKDKQLGVTDLTLKTKGTLRGADSAELPDTYELSLPLKPNDLGAPLVNDQGEVLAIVARACSSADKIGCTLAPYAAPVSAVRTFLRGVPMRRGPWLGAEVVAFDAGVARGVRVAAVAPDSPAASAGLHPGPPGIGDVVLAVNGTPVASAEAFDSAVSSRASGPSSPLRLTVLSDGRYHEVDLLPREAGASTAPAQDRVYQSNPGGTWPRAPRPTSLPNPYR